VMCLPHTPFCSLHTEPLLVHALRHSGLEAWSKKAYEERKQEEKCMHVELEIIPMLRRCSD